MNHRTDAPLPTRTTPDPTPPRTGQPAQERRRGEGPSLWDDYARSLLPPFVRDLPDEMLLAAYGLPPDLLSRPPAQYEEYEDESDGPDDEPEPAPQEKVLGPAGITKAAPPPPLPPGPGPGPPRPPKGIKPKRRRPRVGENPAWLDWLEELLRGGDPWKRLRDLFGDGQRRTVATKPQEIVVEEEERNGQGPPDSSGGNGHPAGDDDGGRTAAFVDKPKTRSDKTKHGYTVFDEFNTPVFGSRGSQPVIDCPPLRKGDPNYEAYHRRGISPDAIVEIKQDLSERLNTAIGELAAKADQIYEPVAALIAVNQALPGLQRRSDKLANVPGIPLTDVRTGGSNPGALPMTAVNQDWVQAQTDLSLADKTKHQLRNIASNARTRVAQRLKEESGPLGLGILLPFIDMLDEPPAKIAEIRRRICQYQIQIAFAEQLVKLAAQAERAILMYENEETARDEDHFVRFVGKVLDTDLFANQVGHAAVTERLSSGFEDENAPQLRGPATDERLRELWNSLDKREKEYFRDQETLGDVEDELQKTRKWASAAFTIAEIAAYEAVGLGAAAVLSRGKRAAEVAGAARRENSLWYGKKGKPLSTNWNATRARMNRRLHGAPTNPKVGAAKLPGVWHHPVLAQRHVKRIVSVLEPRFPNLARSVERFAHGQANLMSRTAHAMADAQYHVPGFTPPWWARGPVRTWIGLTPKQRIVAVPLTGAVGYTTFKGGQAVAK